MTTTTLDDGITLDEAWLIVTSAVLDAIDTVLDHLSPAARDEITTILTRESLGYTDCDDLARSARKTLNHIDYNN